MYLHLDLTSEGQHSQSLGKGTPQAWGNHREGPSSHVYLLAKCIEEPPWLNIEHC